MTSPSLNLKLPDQIRVSIGSAVVLGLIEGKLDAAPLTAYLMTYTHGKCNANCGFCPQAKNSKSNTDLLSRVTWPTFPIMSVIEKITHSVQSGKIKRVCIQALNYSTVFDVLSGLVAELRKNSQVPISVSCQPTNCGDLQRLAKAGLNRIAIAVDAATERLFDQIKGIHANGPYNWENQFRQINAALEVFGKGNVSTHLIIGLGESEKEAISFVQHCVCLSVFPSLFAFTPIKDTALKDLLPPKVDVYRRIQLAQYLIVKKLTTFDSMTFDINEKITDFGINEHRLNEIIETGEPFQTSGCTFCNRPYYNERPSGPIFNFPWKPSREDILTIRNQLKKE